MSTASEIKERELKSIDVEDAYAFSQERLDRLPISIPQLLSAYVPGKKWKDAEGRTWGLAKTRGDQWARFRYYRHSSAQACEADEGHLLRPKKWPIQAERRMEIGGVPVMVDGTLAIDCEHCGAWLIATNSWETEPPANVRLELPAKKGK